MKESLRGLNTTTYKLQVQSVGKLFAAVLHGKLVKTKISWSSWIYRSFSLELCQTNMAKCFQSDSDACVGNQAYRNHLCMLRYTHKRVLELFVNCVHSWLLGATCVGIVGSSGKRGQIQKVVKFMTLLEHSNTVLICLRFMWYGVFFVVVVGVFGLFFFF